MAESKRDEKILFIHAADGKPWTQYLQGLLLDEHDIRSDYIEFKNVDVDDLKNTLIKVLLLTPFMENELKTYEILKADTLSMYIVLYCSVDIDLFQNEYRNMNIEYLNEITGIADNVRDNMTQIILLYEQFYPPEYAAIDETQIPIYIYPQTFYPNQRTLYIAFKEKMNAKYVIKCEGHPDPIVTNICTQNVLSCTLPECDAGYKHIYLYESNSANSILAIPIRIITHESLIDDIYKSYATFKQIKLEHNYGIKNAFKGLHDSYFVRLSKILKMSDKLKNEPDLTEKLNRIELRDSKTMTSTHTLPNSTTRRPKIYYPNRINRRTIIAKIDDLIPPKLPDK